MELTDDQHAYLNEHLDLVAEYAKLALIDRPSFVKIAVPFEVISVVNAATKYATRRDMVLIKLNIGPCKNGGNCFVYGQQLLEYVAEHAHAYVLK